MTRPRSWRGARAWTAAFLAVGLLGTAAAGAAPAAVETAEPARLAARSLLLDGTALGNRLLAVGERGHIVFSDDGGATWKQAQVPTRATLTAVSFVDERTGWAVGHGGVILRTTDGGATWTLRHREGGDGAPLLDVHFTGAHTGLAVGAYGAVLATADGGATWTRAPAADSDMHLYGLLPLRDGRLLVVGEAGSLRLSADGGKSFETLDSPYDGSLFGAVQAADGGILVFGLRGHVFRSDDGGRRWTRVETGVTASIMGGMVRADGTVVLTGLAGTVLVSRDGGRSFRATVIPGRTAFSGAIEARNGQLLLLSEQGVRPAEREISP
ncbi:MAG TPA: YCF48-related protein [Azospirillum sp.]|nr:YCF48-related protein [Azospirillum sp.]